VIKIKGEMLDKLRVILLKPEDPLNIGSVARAMVNLGFNSLTLVCPPDNLDKSKITARRAFSLVQSARTFRTLKEALEGTDFVLGFSTKNSKNAPPVVDLPLLHRSLSDLSPASIALLFGPESRGLTYEELADCSMVVRIPSSDQFDSLNLAQSVMLALYELRRISFLAEPPVQTYFKATREKVEILAALVDKCAQKSRFYTTGTPPRVKLLLLNFFKRLPLSRRETRILTGLFSRIEKSLSEKDA